MNKEIKRWKKLVKKIRKKLPPRFSLIVDDVIIWRCHNIFNNQFPEGLNRYNKKEFIERVTQSLINVFSRRLGYINQMFLYSYLPITYRQFYERFGNLQVADTDSIIFQRETQESVMERVEVHNNGVNGIEASEVVYDECYDSPEGIGRFTQEMAQNIPTPNVSPVFFIDKRCPICGLYLDKYNNFPDWYPKKWRVCCRCYDAYNHHYGIEDYSSWYRASNINEKCENHYNKHKEELEKRFSIQ